MFELQATWWELPLRAAIIYLALLVMVRVSGKRTVGQFTPFDLLVVMLLSEGVSNSLSGGDDSVPGGLLVAATLLALSSAVGWLSARNKAVEKFVDGEPVLIGRDGRWFPEVLKRNRLSQSDVEESLREADCELSQMRCAFLEADGKISILKAGER
ncbi:DUF421 domain-containing protein [Ideonella sp.]|uniref:DUF421 domain-containing protein n=1 Tax=Ideonella sp. TaxID=1929293 RepID=UPI0035AE33B8